MPNCHQCKKDYDNTQKGVHPFMCSEACIRAWHEDHKDPTYRTYPTLNSLAKMIHMNAVAKGFWEAPPSIELLMSLLHSEVSEAFEEYRSGHLPNQPYYREDGKPEGFNAEIADVIIRVLDMCEGLGIDIEQAILEKHKYNTTRPYKHGKKF